MGPWFKANLIECADISRANWLSETLMNIMLQTWGQFNSRIRIDYLKKMELKIINFELEFEFPPKKLNPQINLPLNFFIHKKILPRQSY